MGLVGGPYAVGRGQSCTVLYVFYPREGQYIWHVKQWKLETLSPETLNPDHPTSPPPAPA